MASAFGVMPRKTSPPWCHSKEKFIFSYYQYGLLYLYIIFKILIKIIMPKSRNLGFPQETNTINWGTFWLYYKLFHILLFQTSLFLWLASPFQILDFPGGSAVKRLPAMREAGVWSLGWEDPLEKERATHSSTLAWKIPWTEEPGRLQSMGSQRVKHDWETSLSLSKYYSSKLH